MDATDHELLRQFAAHRSEDAFRRLVNRHVGLVFSVARRVTDDPQLAEEVAQTTFATLAQKAGELRPDDVPAGWLYHTARHLALRAVRSDQRRRQREHLAATMHTDEPGPSVVAEHLEAAMDQLPPADRDALVLRFFEDRNLRDVGHELGLSEDAARMRVNRALEKLRSVFGKLGITGSAAWLGTTLTASATASVPAGLGATITTAVLGGTAVAAATTALVTESTATTMNLFNLKTAAAILGAAAVTGTTTYLVQEREVERLRADYQTLNETHGKLAAEKQEALAMMQLRGEQVERLKRDVADLPRLRGVVDHLNRQLAEQRIAASELERLHGENRELRHLLDLKQNNQNAETGKQQTGIVLGGTYYSFGPDDGTGVRGIGPDDGSGVRRLGPGLYVTSSAQESAGNAIAKAASAGKLANRNFYVDWEKLSAFLGRVDTHIDDSKAASLVRTYLQQSGVQPEVQSHFSVFADRGLIGVASDTNTLERISQLMAPFAPLK